MKANHVPKPRFYEDSQASHFFPFLDDNEGYCPAAEKYAPVHQ